MWDVVKWLVNGVHNTYIHIYIYRSITLLIKLITVRAVFTYRRLID